MEEGKSMDSQNYPDMADLRTQDLLEWRYSRMVTFEVSKGFCRLDQRPSSSKGNEVMIFSITAA